MEERKDRLEICKTAILLVHTLRRRGIHTSAVCGIEFKPFGWQNIEAK